MYKRGHGAECASKFEANQLRKGHPQISQVVHFDREVGSWELSLLPLLGLLLTRQFRIKSGRRFSPTTADNHFSYSRSRQSAFICVQNVNSYCPRPSRKGRTASMKACG